MCLAALRFLIGGIRFQRGILNRDPDEEINIEDVAVAAIELRERRRNPLAPYMSGWHERLGGLEKPNPDTLRLLVDFIYSQLGKGPATPRTSEIAYLARLGDLCELGVALSSASSDFRNSAQAFATRAVSYTSLPFRSWHLELAGVSGHWL